MLTTAEIDRLVDAGCGPALHIDQHTVLDAFQEQVARHPDRVAVDDGSTALTFADLDARATSAAAQLIALGVAAAPSRSSSTAASPLLSRWSRR